MYCSEKKPLAPYLPPVGFYFVSFAAPVFQFHGKVQPSGRAEPPLHGTALPSVPQSSCHQREWRRKTSCRTFPEYEFEFCRIFCFSAGDFFLCPFFWFWLCFTTTRRESGSLPGKEKPRRMCEHSLPRWPAGMLFSSFLFVARFPLPGCFQRCRVCASLRAWRGRANRFAIKVRKNFSLRFFFALRMCVEELIK